MAKAYGGWFVRLAGLWSLLRSSALSQRGYVHRTALEPTWRETLVSSAAPRGSVRTERHGIGSAAIISAVNPYPIDSGKSAVMAGLLEHLGRRLPAGGVHYLHVGTPIADTSQFGDIVIHEMGAPSRADQLRSLVGDAGMRGRSLQEAFLASRIVTARVAGTLAELAPDLEIIDTLRMQQHVAQTAPRGRRILYVDDLFSVRYERMLAHIASGTEESGFDPLGQFGSHLPAAVRGLTQNPHVRKRLLETEARRIRRSEIRAAQASSLSLLLNDREADLLRELSGAQVEVIPPWLPSASSVQAWDGRPEFVFMGLLSLPHNHDGLTYFLQEGLPELLRLVPEARLHIVGRGASERLKDEVALHGDSVIMHGYVPDLDALIGPRCALVNVLRFGSGVKIKVLESLARGLPVVATPVGVEGVTERSRPGICVVHDAREAAQAMARLCAGGTHADEAAGALDIYRAQFSEDVVRRRYDEILGTLPADPAIREITRRADVAHSGQVSARVLPLIPAPGGPHPYDVVTAATSMADTIGTPTVAANDRSSEPSVTPTYAEAW